MAERSITTSEVFLPIDFTLPAYFPLGFAKPLTHETHSNPLLVKLLAIRSAQWQISNFELAQARKVNQHLQETLEAERTRISRDLHDQLGQALVGMKFELTNLKQHLEEPQLNRQRLQDKAAALMAAADALAKSMHQIAWDLRPSLLDDFGLAATLESHAASFQALTGVHCTVTSHLAGIQLTPGASTGIFRMAQEALTNVARHAQATEAHMTLTRSGEHVVLEIRDNGKGIQADDQHKSTSMGLLGMGERAHLLGGTAEVAGVTGQGTTITIKVPLAGNCV
jgi:signal transduction histidine kinase